MSLQPCVLIMCFAHFIHGIGLSCYILIYSMSLLEIFGIIRKCICFQGRLSKISCNHLPSGSSPKNSMKTKFQNVYTTLPRAPKKLLRLHHLQNSHDLHTTNYNHTWNFWKYHVFHYTVEKTNAETFNLHIPGCLVYYRSFCPLRGFTEDLGWRIYRIFHSGPARLELQNVCCVIIHCQWLLCMAHNRSHSGTMDSCLQTIKSSKLVQSTESCKNNCSHIDYINGNQPTFLVDIGGEVLSVWRWNIWQMRPWKRFWITCERSLALDRCLYLFVSSAGHYFDVEQSNYPPSGEIKTKQMRSVRKPCIALQESN